MKTKALFLSFCWLALGAFAQPLSRLDSLLADNLAALDELNPYDLCYEFRGVFKKSCGRVSGGNFRIASPGKNICLISQPRVGLEILISNYLFRKKDFSISLLSGDRKYVYLVDNDGDGGYYKNDPDGYLVINSIFMSTERFLPMNKNEIMYFHERLAKALQLTLLAQPAD